MPPEKYDEIPVFYCKRCRSLLILTDPEIGDYCKECGSTNIGTATIWNYLKIAKTRNNK